MQSHELDLHKKVLVGRILGPWGIKGGVKIFISRDFFSHVAKNIHTMQFFSLLNEEFKFKLIRSKTPLMYVELEGVTDRNSAEKINKEDLYCYTSELPTLESDEYYSSSLLGLPVLDEKGAEIGSILSVDNFGASDIIEVGFTDGVSQMLPFSREIFIQIENDRVIIKLPKMV